MTKREQLRYICDRILYRNQLKLEENASDENITIAMRKFMQNEDCRNCCPCYQECGFDCEPTLLGYLRKHGDEEVEK